MNLCVGLCLQPNQYQDDFHHFLFIRNNYSSILGMWRFQNVSIQIPINDS